MNKTISKDICNEKFSFFNLPVGSKIKIEKDIFTITGKILDFSLCDSCKNCKKFGFNIYELNGKDKMWLCVGAKMLKIITIAKKKTKFKNNINLVNL